ncbi:MAG: GNAT family N-acetyltransferase [Saprospiraceae bacterium]|nr:GNAT family N-acetyltransferase [Saprospiraceae bacterium]
MEERNLDDLKNYLTLDKTAQQQFSGINDEERLLKDLKWAHRKVYLDEPNWRIWYIILEGIVIGNLGFHNISIKNKRAEIGYALHSEFQRKGYMFEAIQSLLSWAISKKLFIRIEAYIAPDNT